MCQKKRTSFDESAAANTAGRELIDSALHSNPLVAVAASVLLPLVGLFRRRRSCPAAAVRKMKLESYSYSPLAAGLKPDRKGVKGDKKASKRQQKGRAKPTSGMLSVFLAHPYSMTDAQKGGRRHG
jgi:hypothetical protein